MENGGTVGQKQNREVIWGFGVRLPTPSGACGRAASWGCVGGWRGGAGSAGGMRVPFRQAVDWLDPSAVTKETHRTLRKKKTKKHEDNKKQQTGRQTSRQTSERTYNRINKQTNKQTEQKKKQKINKTKTDPSTAKQPTNNIHGTTVVTKTLQIIT